MKESKRSRLTGRKTKLTRGLITKICALIRAGNFAETACRAVGIGKSTFYRWLELAEQRGGVYLEFRDALEVASARGEVSALEGLLAQKGPDQLKWFLERRFAERWGRIEPREKLSDTDAKKAIGVMIVPAEDMDKEKAMFDFKVRDANELDYRPGDARSGNGQTD